MWQLIGIILLIITYFIHKHTYIIDSIWEEKQYKPMSPLWMWIILFIISITPFLNILMFIIGAVMYLIGLGDGFIKSTYLDSVNFNKLMSFLKYLNYEV